jgi:hypothetical protein
MENANTPTPPRCITSLDFGQNLREVVTAIISLGIVGITLYILLDTYISAHNSGLSQETYSKQKDILLLTLGFLGTVTGYYLGRVPAEKQADVARDAAARARESESRLKQQVRAGLDSIQQQRSAAGGGAANDLITQEIDRLRAALP